MANVTKSELFSIQTFNSLVVEPLFHESRVLSSGLIVLPTDGTQVYLPVVTGGAAPWRDELEEMADTGIIASELEVVPRKLAVAQIVSSESADDTRSSDHPGTCDGQCRPQPSQLGRANSQPS